MSNIIVVNKKKYELRYNMATVKDVCELLNCKTFTDIFNYLPASIPIEQFIAVSHLGVKYNHPDMTLEKWEEEIANSTEYASEMIFGVGQALLEQFPDFKKKLADAMESIMGPPDTINPN